jgi:hypothetical protein
MPDSPLFKVLTHEEYGRLSLEERMEYLRGLMQDIREKAEENRKRIEETKRLTKPPN